MSCWCNDPSASGSDTPIRHEVGADGCVFQDADADRVSEDRLELDALARADVWGRPIVSGPHSAWSCNDRDCLRHPARLYGAA